MKQRKNNLTVSGFLALSDDEKEAIYKDCELISILDSKPLTKAQRQLRRGRPRVGAGAEKIHISVERTLLRQADATARKLKLSRSEIVAHGLRAFLAGAA